MNRIVHFAIASENPDRAAEFYKSVFNWRIEKWNGPFDYWMVMTGDQGAPGIDGGMFMRDEQFSGSINTIEVDSVDDYIDKVKQAGGTVIRPKNAIPGVGYQAYCKDLDGVIFGIHQVDESAQ